MRYATGKSRDNAYTWEEFNWKENTTQSQVGSGKYFYCLCMSYLRNQTKYRLNELFPKYKSFYVLEALVQQSFL